MSNIENNPNKIPAPKKRDRTGEPPREDMPIDGAILTSNVPLKSLYPRIGSGDSIVPELREIPNSVPITKLIIFPWEDED